MPIDILKLRLVNQGLCNPVYDSPNALVSYFGAFQSQNYLLAKWMLGLRIKNATDAAIEQAFNRGDILRTHIMRPTWHFVTPENIRWLLLLTAPRVHTLNAFFYRRLELDQETLGKSQKILAESLENNNFLTRNELAVRLEKHGIIAQGSRLASILMYAELEGLICSGPRHKKEFTYALLEERVPMIKSIDIDEALSKLTFTYFTSHGPAQIKDFVWWSGLSTTQANKGLEMVKEELVQENIGNKSYWFSHKTPDILRDELPAFLLSILDEYIIGYTDKSGLGENEYFQKLDLMWNTVMVLNGKVVGTWKREIKTNSLEISLHPFIKLGTDEQEAFEKTVDHYRKFTGLPIILTYD